MLCISAFLHLYEFTTDTPFSLSLNVGKNPVLPPVPLTPMTYNGEYVRE